MKIGILCPEYGNKKDWKDSPTIINNDVYIGHFNLPKGLEFDVVIIPHLDHIFPDKETVDKSYELSNIRKLFVAMTRAKTKLVMTTSGAFPEKLSHLLPYCILQTAPEKEDKS